MGQDSEEMATFTKWVIFIVVIGTLLGLYFAWIGPTFVNANGRTRVAEAKQNNQVNHASQGYVAMQRAAMQSKLEDWNALESDISDLKAAGAADKDQQIVNKRSQQKFDLHDIRRRAADTPEAVTADVKEFLKANKTTP